MSYANNKGVVYISYSMYKDSSLATIVEHCEPYVVENTYRVQWFGRLVLGRIESTLTCRAVVCCACR